MRVLNNSIIFVVFDILKLSDNRVIDNRYNEKNASRYVPHGADGTDSGHRGKGGCGLKISEGVGNVEKAVWGRSTLGGYGGTEEALGYLAADRTSASTGGYTCV